MNSVVKKLFLSLAMLMLLACEQLGSSKIAIVHDLQERDANQILVVLNKSGIRAEKSKEEKNQEISWSVTVGADQEQQARDILVANNLPKIRQMGLEGICKDAGLILTPKTEKCREILAYKGEIINSLESIPGVVSADVVLNLPDKEDFPSSDAPPPRPTAAVTILYLPSDLSSKLTESKIQEFVSNAVSDLDPRDVAVVISTLKSAVAVAGTPTGPVTPQQATNVASNSTSGDASQESVSEAEMSSVLGLKMDEESAKKFKVLAALFLVLFLVLAGGLIFMLLRISRLKQAPAATAGGESSDQKLLEA